MKSGSFDLVRGLDDMMAEVQGVDFKKLAKSFPLPAAGVVSSAALIAGCMIGAGVLALPSVTIHSGLMPSSFAILSVWAYCAASGLLIGEVCINSKGKEGRKGGREGGGEGRRFFLFGK